MSKARTIYDINDEIVAARKVEDWDLVERLCDERRVAEVEADEASIRSSFVAMGNAVEFFYQHGKTSYADEIRSIQDEMSIARSDYGYQSEEYIEIKKMMEAKIESIRKEAEDRFEDLRTDCI